jgi:hypothetical protein|tara:strand:+ start:4909 stop:5166 length:258 start_codon:yes stop_codon:yes gene_type:complete
MREIIEKYYRQEHSALSEEDIEDQNCIHTPDEMIDFALSVVKNCSIPDVVRRSEQLLCINCNKSKSQHSTASSLCDGRFSHFEAK